MKQTSFGSRVPLGCAAVDFGLRQRVSVVTGGSSGIGLASARILLAEGARVLIVARSQERLEAARADLAAPHDALGTLAVDVTDPDAPVRICEAALTAFGRIDALVNCAGSSRLTAIDSGPLEPWYAQWELNVVATKRLIETLAPRIAEGDGGTIVNVASSAGRRPSATDAAYSVAKRGMLALTQVYAQRLAAAGVRVVAVAPGPTETPLWTETGGRLDEVSAAAGRPRDEVLGEVEDRLPLGRLASAEEVATAVVLAVAGLSGDGSVLAVDGGHVTEDFGAPP